MHTVSCCAADLILSHVTAFNSGLSASSDLVSWMTESSVSDSASGAGSLTWERLLQMLLSLMVLQVLLSLLASSFGLFTGYLDAASAHRFLLPGVLDDYMYGNTP